MCFYAKCYDIAPSTHENGRRGTYLVRPNMDRSIPFQNFTSFVIVKFRDFLC